MTGRSVETILKYVVTKKPTKKITSSESVINWRKRTKQKLIQYKGGSCELCGYYKCERALEFHHINPEEKDFSISGKSLSFDKLKDEVDKCMLVCSNCHCEIHDGLINL
jgi:5-methylcytosine-specific restriction endonuclease McrA